MNHQAMYYLLRISLTRISSACLLLCLTSAASVADQLTLPISYINGQVLTKESLNDNFVAVESEVNKNHSRITNNETTVQSLTANSLSALTSCGNSQIAKYVGSQWICADDVKTTYTQGSGISIIGNVISATGGTDTLADLVCGNTQIAKYNTTTSTWQCAYDDNTTYTQGSGISISGKVISATPPPDTLTNLNCSDTQIAKYSKLTTAWECTDDANTVNVESGVDYTEYETTSTNVNLSTTVAEVERVTISTTSAGFVIVNFSAYYRINHTTTVLDSLEVDISDSATPAINTGSRRFVAFGTNAPTQEVFAPISMQKIYPILANTSKTFYVYGKSSDVAGSGNIRFTNPQTYALFIPNRM